MDSMDDAESDNIGSQPYFTSAGASNFWSFANASFSMPDGAPNFWSFPNGSFSMPDRSELNSRVCGMDNSLAKVYSRGWLGSLISDDYPIHNSLTYLMFQLVIFLLVSRTLYIILRSFKQPRIICDLITGIIFGPTLIGQTSYNRAIYQFNFNLTFRSLGGFGLMYHFFLTGVKMNPSMVLESGREAGWVGIGSVLFPFTITAAATYLLRDFIPAGIARGKFLIFLVAATTIAAFPVMGDMLAELRILNTELGRLGMSSAMINCIFGWFFMAIFTAMQQFQGGLRPAVFSILSLIVMLVVIIFGLRPCMRWIVKKTPKGTQVREEHMAFVLVCVMVLGLISDAIGASPVDGPLLLGLIVPDGPPLGSALVKRVELVVSEVLMPLFFFSVGGMIKFPDAASWVYWFPVIAIVLIAYTSKIVGTILPAMFCNLPFRNAAILGLIMSFRGVVEIIILYYFKLGKLLDQEGFSVLMLMVLLSTAVSVPLVSVFYEPLESNRRWGRCTIQHMRTHAELPILVAVHNEGPVPFQLQLMEATSSFNEGPLSIYVIHLVDLDGRANSTLISHKNRRGFLNPTGMDRLLNAFINYEAKKKGHVTVIPFTSISPYSSMHQDICSLASQRRTALIIVPFPRKDPTMEHTPSDHAIQSALPEILRLASCSVGILIHHTISSCVLTSPTNFQYQVGVLFWGGADDREALSYASRMASHIGVTLIVTRFVPAVDKRGKRERQLDDSLVEDFKIAHSNNGRLMFKDVLANDSEETLKAVRSIDIHYDLLIVGRRQGQNACLSETLVQWSETPELGIVGDVLCSKDFKWASTILIIQQHG